MCVRTNIAILMQLLKTCQLMNNSGNKLVLIIIYEYWPCNVVCTQFVHCWWGRAVKLGRKHSSFRRFMRWRAIIPCGIKRKIKYIKTITDLIYTLCLCYSCAKKASWIGRKLKREKEIWFFFLKKICSCITHNWVGGPEGRNTSHHKACVCISFV